jgi:hypothetical protein
MPEIEITPAMVRQYEGRRIAISDPCIICGGHYWTCGHRDDTPLLIKRIKSLGKDGRKRILDRQK